MLYLGQKKSNLYIFHTLWALRTNDRYTEEGMPVEKDKGRIIIGKSVIMPLNFSLKYKNIDKTLLEKLHCMILLAK